jgi:hypothetical protein
VAKLVIPLIGDQLREGLSGEALDGVRWIERPGVEEPLGGRLVLRRVAQDVRLQDRDGERTRSSGGTDRRDTANVRKDERYEQEQARKRECSSCHQCGPPYTERPRSGNVTNIGEPVRLSGGWSRPRTITPDGTQSCGGDIVAGQPFLRRGLWKFAWGDCGELGLVLAPTRSGPHGITIYSYRVPLYARGGLDFAREQLEPRGTYMWHGHVGT